MKISEINLGTRSVSMQGKVISISEPREVNTRYGQTRVATAVIEDETGSIILTLWGKQIDDVKPGSVIKIEGGYTTEFKGELQINVSKKGSLEVVE